MNDKFGSHLLEFKSLKGMTLNISLIINGGSPIKLSRALLDKDTTRVGGTTLKVKKRYVLSQTHRDAEITLEFNSGMMTANIKSIMIDSMGDDGRLQLFHTV